MTDVTRQELQYSIIRIMHESGLIHDVEAIGMFKDASNEIVDAINIDFASLGYATQDYNRTDSSPVEILDDDEYTPEQERLLEKYAKWRKGGHRLERSICISIAKHKTSLDLLAFGLIKSEAEVVKFYHDGLKRWVDLFFK